MPTANIYFEGTEHADEFRAAASEIRRYLAKELTCEDIQLTSEEISLRFIENAGAEMIGKVEVQISAHSFPERVAKQEEICLNIMNYLQDRIGLKNMKVWLQLSELGHSWS